MRKLIALLVLCAFVLSACNSSEVRVPDDWRQHTEFCLDNHMKKSAVRYSFWYPPEWTEYESGIADWFMGFESSAREGGAYAATHCHVEDLAAYWGEGVTTIEGALQAAYTTATMGCSDDLKITESSKIKGPHGDMFILAHSCTNEPLGWESHIQIVTYSSPVVTVSYSAEHDITQREHDLLLEVMQTVRFSE